MDRLGAFESNITQRTHSVKTTAAVNNIINGPELPSDDVLAVHVATEVDEYFKNSKIMSEEAKMAVGRIARLDKRELETGRKLGSGGFSTVWEISKISLFKAKPGGNDLMKFSEVIKENYGRKNFGIVKVGDEDNRSGWKDTDLMNQEHDRKQIHKHHLRDGISRYAIKMLHSSYESDPQQHFSGIIDLAVETRFLSVIRHPNILKMRAISLSDPYKSNFFIILDKVYGTLDDKINEWFREHRKNNGCLKQLMGGKKAQEKLFNERLLIMFDIASAVQHLHSLGILYRDLKPENLGFDIKGKIKLFDFGLAVELVPETMLENGTYAVDPGGTRRYMPPEVVKNEPCNLSVDVYSFGILLWGVLALDSAFKFLSEERHTELVVHQNHRPTIPPSWPSEIQSFLPACWHEDMFERPNFDEIVDMFDELTVDFMTAHKPMANNSSFSSVSYTY